MCVDPLQARPSVVGRKSRMANILLVYVLVSSRVYYLLCPVGIDYYNSIYICTEHGMNCSIFGTVFFLCSLCT